MGGTYKRTGRELMVMGGVGMGSACDHEQGREMCRMWSSRHSIALRAFLDWWLGCYGSLQNTFINVSRKCDKK